MLVYFLNLNSLLLNNSCHFLIYLLCNYNPISIDVLLPVITSLLVIIFFEVLYFVAVIGLIIMMIIIFRFYRDGESFIVIGLFDDVL